MAKKKSAKKKSTKKSAAKKGKKNVIPFPTGLWNQTPLEQAQELIYDALESPHDKAMEMARKALEISPDCADAYNLLAEDASTVREAFKLYEKGVAAGKRALGANAFKEDVGHFWGLLETRPFMRAMAGLADCLWEMDRRDDAIEHYREMLRLNPNDNQGMRDVLMKCLLSSKRWKEAEALHRQYENDSMAVWMYSRALLDFQKHGDVATSIESLIAAFKQNPHVPQYLTGKKRLPKALPGYHGFGDENEAVLYAANHKSSWKVVPNALDWLKKNA
jgi:tetratricopeptide (TPR) repeat protein